MRAARVCRKERGREETGAKVEFGADSLKQAAECMQSVCREVIRTAWAAVTYLLKKARYEGSSSITTEPLRALTKSIAGCIEAWAAPLLNSGFTWMIDRPYRNRIGNYSGLEKKCRKSLTTM